MDYMSLYVQLEKMMADVSEDYDKHAELTTSHRYMDRVEKVQTALQEASDAVEDMIQPDGLPPN